MKKIIIIRVDNSMAHFDDMFHYPFQAGGRGIYLCFVYRILFQFEEKGLDPVEIEAQEGETILEVALKHNIRLHHNCGGVCACSTCHIYLEEGEQYVEEISEKEEDFIDRARNPRLNSRLACQCVLHSGEGHLLVTIPDQSVILGE